LSVGDGAIKSRAITAKDAKYNIWVETENTKEYQSECSPNYDRAPRHALSPVHLSRAQRTSYRRRHAATDGAAGHHLHEGLKRKHKGEAGQRCCSKLTHKLHISNSHASHHRCRRNVRPCETPQHDGNRRP
jgi:hypothetical protein